VRVEPDATVADQTFRSLVNSRVFGSRRVRAPDIGEAAYAEASRTRLLLIVRERNVVVLVAERSNSDLDLTIALSALRLMVERVKHA
jgi:hypothetical protein